MWVGPNQILTYYFDGDTLVGGHLCKKWWCNDVLLAPVFEENKYYTLGNSGFNNAKVGNNIPVNGTLRKSDLDFDKNEND